jgi:uncharacterized membrane protein YdjX (TVP38/TMEM64 family)
MNTMADSMPQPHTSSLRRFVAPAVILSLMALGYALRLHSYLTLSAIAENRADLEAFTANNLPLAVLIYAALYITIVALSFPGATVLTIVGGFLFGWLVGGISTIIAATLGATVIFQIARSSFGESLARRAGPFLSKLKQGFETDAFNYLLFLRLVPAFPFWLVNIAPALSNVSLRIFATATLIGIIPGTFAFAFIGAGLGSVLDAQAAEHARCVAEKTAELCSFNLSPSHLVTRELIYAFVALGIVSLIPIAIRKWKHNRA